MGTPRVIWLPSGTLVNGSAQSSVVAVIETQIGGMFADAGGNANISTINTQNVYQVPCGAVASAYNLIQQIQNFLYSSSQGTITPKLYVANSPTFASVYPPATSITYSGTDLDITGTNFLLSGINLYKLDDGAGHVFVGVLNPGVYNLTDTFMNFNEIPQVTFAAVYTLYYSTNNGSSWTTTGLTITAS